MAQNYILAWSLEIRAHAIRPQSIIKFKSLFLVSWVVKLLQISFDNVLFDQIQKLSKGKTGFKCWVIGDKFFFAVK